jgi:hypothetical protein
MAQATHLARTTAADRALVHAAGTNYTLVQSTQTYVNDVAAMLAEAVWYIDAAADGYSGAQTVPNLGTGGTALDATLGSTGGADTNDPTWLEGTPALYVPGGSGNTPTVAHSSGLDITGDVDIAVWVAVPDWSPAANVFLLRKGNSNTNHTYSLQANTAGGLSFAYSDGTSRLVLSSTTSGLTDGTGYWVRATKRASDQKVKFYTSTDPSSTAWGSITWTQVGTDRTIAGSGTAAGNTIDLLLGGSSTTALEGSYRRVIVRNGFDGAGSTVLDVDTATGLTSGDATTITATTGTDVTINRAASGRKTVAVVEEVFLLGVDDYIDSAATGTSQIIVNRTWSGSTPTFTVGYNTSPDGQIGSGGKAPTDGEVIASAMWDRTLTAGEQAALLTYFQTRG